MVDSGTTRRLGAIYTPPEFAEFLTSWAIQGSAQQVLDVGVGEGVFAFSAYRRLLELGADPIQGRDQVYGAEVDGSTYASFFNIAKRSFGHFPNIHNDDFFGVDFPLVDAVVGNPPYVRRTYIDEVDRIRGVVLDNNLSMSESDLPRMSDLYIYFLLHASSLLKSNGRLAVITADSWMNTGYGANFREYLKRHFYVESLVSLDRRVFDDAQVRPVLLFAVKKPRDDSKKLTSFVRVKNGLPIAKVQELLENGAPYLQDLVVHKIELPEPKRAHPWSVHFTVPEVYEKLAAHSLMTPLANLAETRIGVQTLAKDFFVLTPERAQTLQIESRFLEPLAQSSRYLTSATIDNYSSEPDFYVFYCSEDEAELAGTNCLQYILQGESTTVKVRGKNEWVTGYQNKKRIKRSGRRHWYDLKTSLERRGRAQILIPRLMYRKATVVWNRANYVPGELFIECIPFQALDVDVEVYLALLNSSCVELLLRAYAQVYGGGTFNLNPGQVKEVPVPNVSLLSEGQKRDLKQAYVKYLSDERNDRSAIDSVVFGILDFDEAMKGRIKSTLEDLILLALTSKETVSAHP